MMKRIGPADFNSATQAYWLATVFSGVAVLVWALFNSLLLGRAHLFEFIGLLILICITSSNPLRIPGTKAVVSASDVFIFFSVLTLGVPAAVILGAVDNFINVSQSSKRWSSRISSPALMVLSVMVSGHVFYWTLTGHAGIAANPLGETSVNLTQLIAPVIAMAVTQYLLNGLFLTVLYGLKNRCSLLRFWRVHYLWTSWTFFAAAIGTLIIYQAMARFGFLYVFLAVPVIAATYATYRVYFARVDEKTREAAEAGRLHLATVEALASAIDAKDQTTHLHIRRVQIYAAGLARVLELSPLEKKALEAGALLHDVGKLAVPDHILNKPEKLTASEFSKMMTHTSVGADIIERVGFPYPVVPIIRYHHERWDGLGYPEGLKGEDIPVTARIIAVVDTFDSAREDRPHRRGLTAEEARSLVLRRSGRHYDPRVVDAFLLHLPEFEAEIKRRGCEQSPPLTTSMNGSEAASGALAPRDSLPYLEQIKSAHREIYALYEIARTFGTSLNVSDTLAIIVDRVRNVVPWDTCVVYLYDEVRGVAQAARVAGKNEAALTGRQILRGQGVTGFVLANRHPLQQVDPSLDFAHVSLPDGEYRSMVSLPLVKDERLIGALSIYSMELADYSADHFRLLETVSRLAADALANALQHAEAESNALTDPLTGIANGRCMYLRFEQEAARARRSSTPLQVVMLDLDHFKQVNDQFGHSMGDQMLRQVASVLQAQLREYDFLARYGGDEFVAIVPDMTREQVKELCYRIETVIDRFSLDAGGGRRAQVGISTGAASYIADGETLDELLLAADRAMYKTKTEHRERLLETATEAESASLASSAVN
jgi:diguanylate cyclase (GGDEF)-like protein/putative nucleotidyltransferase with HDIG domain